MILQWDQLEQGEVAITHLSDVHFGSEDAHQTWTNLATCLKQDVKPGLLLVSGDLVNSPSKAAFDEARANLEKLDIPVFICAGNHDRSIWGNAVGHWLARVFKWARRFDAAFHEAVPIGPQPRVSRLGLIPVHFEIGGWRLRLAALDSSKAARFSASGFVPLEEINAFETASKVKDPADLSIMLFHHHLIPVRAKEKLLQDQGRFTDFMSVRNAGTLLERIATANVDLVLHGHHHQDNLASYGTLNDSRNHSIVIGAGSATGARTLRASAPNLASFNVIVLKRDRSCELRLLSHQGGEWSVIRHAVLCEPETIRQRRTFRQVIAQEKQQIRSVPRTKVTKLSEFTPKRDIRVAEVRASWELTDDWRRKAKNGTGIPIEPVVEIVGAGASIRHKSLRFEGKPPLWELVIPIRNDLRHKPMRLSCEYCWLAGGLLTREELDHLGPGDEELSDLRARGYEWSSISPLGVTRSAQLTVVVPPAFAPDQFSIFELDPEGGVLGEDTDELRACFTIVGKGRCILDVPWPNPDSSYAIAWRPPRAPAPVIFDLKTGDLAKVQKIVERQLGAGAVAEFCLLRDQKYRRVEAHGVQGSRERALLDEREAVLIQAWWGRIAVFRRPEKPDLANRMGFDPDEQWLAVAPVRPPDMGIELSPWPLALLRIGIKTPQAIDSMRLAQAVHEALQAALTLR